MHDVPPALRAAASLVDHQLRAVAAYHVARKQRETALAAAAATRELRLEANRRLDAIRREHAALLARAEDALRESARPLEVAAPRAVVAHRQDWVRAKVAQGLEEHGVEVLAAVEDGADASAAVVFEQPDLVFLEDRLPSLSGIEVVERARAFAPQAAVGVQLLDDRDAPMFTESGAAVFTRRVPPAEVAEHLVAQLRSRTDEGLVRS